MKVLNLRCAAGHAFEGWFGSESDFQSQQSRGQLVCPLCGVDQINRLPSAPRLNLSGAKSDEPHAGTVEPTGAAAPTQPGPAPASLPVPSHTHALQDAWVAAVKAVLSNTEDVGPAFAEEARRIHYGESELRGIRGVATDAERVALTEEGIEVHTLAVPEALKGRTH